MPDFNKSIKIVNQYANTRYYRTTRDGSDALFAIETEVYPVEYYKSENLGAEIIAKLYLLTYEGPRYNVFTGLEKPQETWRLKTYDHSMGKTATFESSLFLPDYLQGLGIGTVLLNHLIEIGKVLIPEASVSVELAYHQSTDEENRERRHNFYNHFGFEIRYKEEPKLVGHGTKAHIKDLKTTIIEEIEGIEEVSIYSTVQALNRNVERLELSQKSQLKANKEQSGWIRELQEENWKLKKYKYVVYAFIGFGVVLLWGKIKSLMM